MSINLRSAETVTHVFEGDHAIDTEASNYALYIETGDEKHLVYKPGCRPSKFELKRLPARTYAACMAEKSLDGRALELVSYSLQAVENMQGRDARPIKLEFTKSSFGKRLTERCIDDFYSPELFAQLAVRVIMLSSLDPLTAQA